MEECEDRWYGQLLAHSFESTTDGSSSETPIPAAAAIELFRGYCRLRTELFVQIHGAGSSPSRRELTSSLLAGDYLYASAFSTLGAVRDDALEECFRTLTTVSETVIEAHDATPVRRTRTGPDYCRFVDKTAGVLGEGAAVIGAQLARVDDSRHAEFATLGRDFATGRNVLRAIDSEPDAVRSLLPSPDEPGLRRHADRRLEAAQRAFRELSGTVDVNALRAFFERTVPLGDRVLD